MRSKPKKKLKRFVADSHNMNLLVFFFFCTKKEKERGTDILQSHRQTNRKTGRQKGRQTERQTDKKRQGVSDSWIEKNRTES